MRDRRVNWGVAFCAAVAIALCAAYPLIGNAQEWSGKEGSTTSGPSLKEYLQQVGPEGTVIGHGQLKIDGRPVNCGKRPTVLNPNFDSWGGAFPGFLILNTKKLDGLSTPVKLYLYSHECGHQFVGADEVKADFFAVRRGMKLGWLNAQGMKDICTFISKLKATAAHPPGPQRCEAMRKYYRQLIEGAGQQARAPAPAPRPQTLAPAQ